MKVVRIALVLLLLSFTYTFAFSQPGSACTREDTFPTSCSPFHAGHHQPIDVVCGPAGDAADASDAAQDTAKNNLCSTGSPVEISVDDLKDFQDAVDSSTLVYGNRHVSPSLPPPPVDREKFFGATATQGPGNLQRHSYRVGTSRPAFAKSAGKRLHGSEEISDYPK